MAVKDTEIVEDKVSDMAKAAEEIEEKAKEAEAAGVDFSTYTHHFKKPFTYAGRTFDKLTFDWESLTGRDSLAIESELSMKGKTLVLPAYTGEYLVGMAARACTERDDGKRVAGTDMLQAMPLGDFQKICGRARNFLLRSGL